MILVIPDGTNSLGGSQFRSSPVIGDYETCFTRDIVGYVDSHYRTLPSRDSRALSGCCSGGVVAMRLGLKYPNVFSVVAATDAGLDESLEAWPGDVDRVRLLKKLPESLIDARMNSVVAWYIQAAAAVAPDPDNPPFYCQMPIRIVDGHGEFVPEVIAKIVDDDAVHRARRYAQQSERLRGIYVRKSLSDPDFDLPMRNFVQALNDLGIEHEYEEVKTVHCGLGWEEASLKFIASKLVFEEQ
jgi:enterochelin esterase-like enzyme